MKKREHSSLLAEVSHDEAKMRERRESLSFLSFLPRRERPLLAGKEHSHSEIAKANRAEWLGHAKK